MRQIDMKKSRRGNDVCILYRPRPILLTCLLALVFNLTTMSTVRDRLSAKWAKSMAKYCEEGKRMDTNNQND